MALDGTVGCYLIAEVGQAHDGSLGYAHSFIDAAADAGASFIKFQTHIADAESHPSEPWRVKFSRQDETRFDYWKRMEFTEAGWRGLYEHAKSRSLGFMSSPFSIDAIDLLRTTGIDAWKIASGEIAHHQLLASIPPGDPVYLSSGMSSVEELRPAVEHFRGRNPLVLMQCTSLYPTPPSRLGLNLIRELQDTFGVPTGLSDHSGTIFAGLGAVALGAVAVEVHVCHSRTSFGPDVPASLTFEELGTLAEGIAFLTEANANPVDKRIVPDDIAPMRDLFGRSVCTTRLVRAGEIIGDHDVTLKKPAGGIPPDLLADVLGMRARDDLPPGTLLSFDHLERP